MSHSILIADDSLFIRKALCELFAQEEAFEVCGEAENGREAVAKAQELHPDLVLLDLSMPVMNGLDATRVLKRLMPEVPVIMFSGYSDSLTEKEARSAGVLALVSKSEHISVLLGKVRCALEPQAGRDIHPRSASSRPREKPGLLHSKETGGTIVHDLQLARGDICGDPTGLRVRVEDIDIYDYVHFSIVERSDSGEHEAASGEMSHVAFAYRFTKLGNTFYR
jgi:two-component system chemotaxis response regulator CheY